MTRPEPAGVGTAEEIAREYLGVTPAALFLRDEITAAITAAESRAMERCAKMADKYADDSEAAAEQFDDMAKRQSNDDDYFRLALTRRRIAGDMRLFAKGIRSSINPPGEEENG